MHSDREIANAATLAVQKFLLLQPDLNLLSVIQSLVGMQTHWTFSNQKMSPPPLFYSL